MAKVSASKGAEKKKPKKSAVLEHAVLEPVGPERIVVEPIELTTLGDEFREGHDERADAPDLHLAGLHLYRASMLGDCESTLVAYALEETPGELPDAILARANEGTRLEKEILDRACEQMGARTATFPEMVELVEQGLISGYNHTPEFGNGGQVQVCMKTKTAMLFCHLDRLVRFESGEFAVMEAKALGPDFWKIFTKNRIEDALAKMLDGKYAWQVSAQMVTGLPLVFVAGQKEGKDEECRIVDVQWKRLDVPVYSKKEIKARIKSAESHVKAGVIPGCGEGRFGCPYYAFTFHEKKQKEEVKWLVDAKYEELMRYVRERHVAGQDRKDAQAIYDSMGEHIDALLTELELDRSKKFGFEDEAHNKFTLRWVVREMGERFIPAGSQKFAEVKLMEEK